MPMKLKIKILSPVHIGSGEKKNKMSFIQEGNRVYFINEEFFLKLIDEEKITDVFIQWVNGGGSNISLFFNNYNQYKHIRKKLLERPLYCLPVKGSIDREITLHIKDANNNFYIPGSSIKGAIRTALLYNILKEGKPDTQQLLYGVSDTDIKGVLNIDSDKGKWAGMEIEKFTLRAGVKKELDSGKIIKKYDDAKYDLLRFIHISDINIPLSKCSIIPVRTFSSVSEDLMSVKSFITNIEIIENGQYELNIDIEMKRLLALKNIDTSKEWIDINDKLEKCFGFKLHELTIDNLDYYREKILDRILNFCKVFSKDKMIQDLHLIKNKKIKIHKQCGTSLTVQNECPKCKNSLTEKEIETISLETIEHPYRKIFQNGDTLIQIGFGSGWKGKTTGMYFDHEQIKQFRKKFNGIWKGKLLRDGGLLNIFPKTLRFAMWSEKNNFSFLPLGWVKLEKL